MTEDKKSLAASDQWSRALLIQTQPGNETDQDIPMHLENWMIPTAYSTSPRT